MTRVVSIEGELKLDGRYAVFSTTTNPKNSLSFAFFLPLTVAVWSTRGFDSLVIIVGNKLFWEVHPLYKFVLSSLETFQPVIVFMETRPEQEIMISQVSRLFISNILYNVSDGVYLLTSDSDLWPVSYPFAYRLPRDKQVDVDSKLGMLRGLRSQGNQLQDVSACPISE